MHNRDRKHYLYICLLIFLQVFVLSGCYAKPLVTPDMTMEDGTVIKIDNSTVLCSSNISSEDADAFKTYFSNRDFMKYHNYIKFDKSSADEYMLYIYDDDFSLNHDPQQQQLYQNLANNMSIILFSPKYVPVSIYLCDVKFNVEKSFSSTKPSD